MKMLRRMTALLLVCMLLCGGAMAAAYKAQVFGGSLKVYDKIGTGARLLGTVRQGTEITVGGFSSDRNWARISVQGKTGYASTQNIRFLNRIRAISTAETSMRFFTAASFQRKLAYDATIAKGTTIYVVGYHNGYFLVENAAGNAFGIVQSKYFQKY